MIKKVSLGIEELDRLLGGGIPEPSTLLIIGDVGTGKSVLCQQFAYFQAKSHYNVVYFCIDNPPKEVRSNMETFWDLEDLVGLTFVDVHSEEPEMRWINVYNYEDLLSGIRRYFKGRRFVFDSISTLAMIHGERKVYDLVRKIQSWTLKSESISVISAVRGMHSRRFEIAIKQVLNNVMLLEKEGEEVFVSVEKTMKTHRVKGKFGLEIDERGIRIVF